MTAVALSKAPRSEAAAALVLGQAGHVQGTLRTNTAREGWAVETPDGVHHPLARHGLVRLGWPGQPPSQIPGGSDLSAPAAVLHRIPWCGIDRRPSDGWLFETTAHARLAAAEVVQHLALVYGLDPSPWIS